jgi:succinyl-diaminopimelate desuccinylase
LFMTFGDSDAPILSRTVQDLIAIRSLSGDEARAADYVQAALVQGGLSPVRDEEDNVWAVCEPRVAGNPADVTLHLSGHTDTVVPVEGWNGDPWTPRLEGLGEDARIVGLGASDMKAGLAVMLHVARHFAKPENRLQGLRLVTSFTVCEEMPAKNKKNGVNRLLARETGRWAITTEASCDTACPTIALGCQAHAVAQITLTGRSSHSASPERGINAVHAAGKICARVEEHHAGYLDQNIAPGVNARAAMAVTKIHGGSAGNIIPEHCELTLSRRLAPGETVADFERELEVLTEDLGGVVVRWNVRCDAPACVADMNGPLLKHATHASNTLYGQSRYSWNRARTDMVLFAQAGMDVINIGPGYFGQAHVAGEFVRVIDLVRSANLIAETLKSLDAEMFFSGYSKV